MTLSDIECIVYVYTSPTADGRYKNGSSIIFLVNYIILTLNLNFEHITEVEWSSAIAFFAPVWWFGFKPESKQSCIPVRRLFRTLWVFHFLVFCIENRLTCNIFVRILLRRIGRFWPRIRRAFWKVVSETNRVRVNLQSGSRMTSFWQIFKWNWWYFLFWNIK